MKIHPKKIPSISIPMWPSQVISIFQSGFIGAPATSGALLLDEIFEVRTPSRGLGWRTVVFVDRKIEWFTLC